MKLDTVCYSTAAGWSDQPRADLDSERTLVVVFGSPELDRVGRPLQDLCARFGRSHVVGCSTAGEIFGDSLADNSLSVAVAQFDHGTRVASASAGVQSQDDSFAAGESIARQLDHTGLRGVLLFSDGLNVNGTELVRGLNSILPSDVVVTGGLAGDGSRFQRTWVVHEGDARSNMVCAVGLYGENVSIGHGSKGGWDNFGPERRVTRSRGNVLIELDGRPALELYKEYLGDLASGLPATGLLFPLALRSTADDEKSLVRTILAVDEAAQTMTFAGDMPEGSLARLMRANYDRLIDGASDAASMAGAAHVDRFGERAETLAIAISCVGRRLVLGERAEEEIEATLELLPTGTRQIGFYAYGEISPYARGQCDLHNQTMTLTTIRESAAAA
ncbi:MAG: FIST C-terminal domain-containing protein [Chloroflexota bacterium]|nr:FIST C-terminal domain-containing protein [Chloroflexota bacterium]